jgi:hypothetical protein
LGSAAASSLTEGVTVAEDPGELEGRGSTWQRAGEDTKAVVGKPAMADEVVESMLGDMATGNNKQEGSHTAGPNEADLAPKTLAAGIEGKVVLLDRQVAACL